MHQMTLKIGGMTCGHCVAAVTNALKSVEGVEVEKVAVGEATVAYDPASTSPDAIARAVEEEGYTVAGK